MAVKYADDSLSDYALICFIQSGTIGQAEANLSDLADVLKISGPSLDKRLKSLRTYFERHQERALLIFDGVVDEETLAYVCERLPSRGCTTLLVSSRLKGSAASVNFSQLS